MHRRQMEFGRENISEKRTSVYDDYVAVLSSLYESPDPDAPGFMSSEAWAAKSCQTGLSGWAQMRHTFALQAKLTVVTFGMHDQPAGFIEPNPAFFRRMSEFLRRTRAKLEWAGVFTATPNSAAARLRSRSEMMERIAAKLRNGTGVDDDEEYADLAEYLGMGGFLGDFPAGVLEPDVARGLLRGVKQKQHWAQTLPQLSAFLAQAAKQLETGVASVPTSTTGEWHSLSSRWSEFQQTVDRLETLLQKQLRGQPWNYDEAKFIKGYGPVMAACMGYFGNSYQPRDDAPRCVEVVRFAANDTSLVAAVGRPRALYVLYPWKGIEVFCEGAVMPYYEFSSRDRLTDEAWRQRLNSSDAPHSPDWVGPLLPSGKTEATSN